MNMHGDFIWYELMTGDVEAAIPFYEAVLKWTAEKFDNAPGGYWVFSRDGAGIAGGMVLPAEAVARGARPGWIGYVGVDDVDVAVRDILAAGGAAHMPATDIPGVGRMAMLADPQGAMFYVMRGSSDEASAAFDQARPGHGNWNELHTSDPSAGLDFYAARFGWSEARVFDMGPIGDYRIIGQGGREIGGVMKAQPGGPPATWCFYFGVEDIHATAEAIRANGGSVMHSPAEVPGGAYTLVAADPQGAVLGFVGPAKG